MRENIHGLGASIEAGAPLWSRVMMTIRQGIIAGRYPIGSVLPREVDLATEFDVSRNTVREAIRRLAGEGLLVRRKRLGTRVIADAPAHEVLLDLDPQFSLRSLSEQSEIHILNRDRVHLPPEINGVFWVDDDAGDWLRVEYLRTMSGVGDPLSWTEIYLSPDLHDLGAMVGRRKTEFFRLIEERRQERMLRTKTQLAPTKVGSRLAAILHLDPEELALKVTHAMLNEAGACREVVVSVYPARNYRFEVSFKLQDG